MRAAVIALLAFAAVQLPSAQAPARSGASLAGTWMLVSMQRAGAAGEPVNVQNPRGMLAFDRVGHAVEIATTSRRIPNAGAQATAAEAQATYANYQGFWGGYRVDEAQKRLVFKPAGALNPNVMGKELTRSFELADDRLTVTALPDATAVEKGMRWTWERVPVLGNMPAADRRVVGFWEHEVERRVNVTTGAVISETRRAPSIIAYTSSGFVGVHFPSLTRIKAFAGDAPTDDEARAAIQGYVGYYGIFLVYPGVVYHHQLANLGGPTTSFRRFFEISGSEINLKFPPAMNQGQMVRTVVTLKRLSGYEDMK